MTSDPNEVQLAGKRIGYTQQWKEWPDAWDGFTDIDDAFVDDLICNGASKPYCEYKIFEAYRKHLMEGLEPVARSMRTPEERRAFHERVSRILECGREMNTRLEMHYKEVFQTSTS